VVEVPRDDSMRLLVVAVRIELEEGGAVDDRRDIVHVDADAVEVGMHYKVVVGEMIEEDTNTPF